MSIPEDFLNGIHLYLKGRGLLVEVTLYDNEFVAEHGYVSVFLPDRVCRVWVDKRESNLAGVAFYLKSGERTLNGHNDRRDWPDGHYAINNPFLLKRFDLSDPGSLPWLYDFMNTPDPKTNVGASVEQIQDIIGVDDEY